jgi:hypothetical protein
MESRVMPGTTPEAWEQAAARVSDYLRVMGITDPLHQERLLLRVRQRWDARIDPNRLDSREAAIEETYGLLSEWLVAELGIVGDQDALLSARAAVLSGMVPSWTARFAGVSGESCAPAIRVATVVPVPSESPLTMVPNTIELFWRRIGRALASVLRRLLGLLPHEPADAHPGSPR